MEEIKRTMEELPPDGGRRLFELWKQVPGDLKRGQARTAVDELRFLLGRLSESESEIRPGLQDHLRQAQRLAGFKLDPDLNHPP